MEVPIVDQGHRDMLGADVYGRMRSPWNVNSRQYLTRGLGEMCGEQSTDFCELFFHLFFKFCFVDYFDPFVLLVGWVSWWVGGWVGVFL